MTRVRTEQQLAAELKKQPDLIEIEGDLGKKVLRIKAVGPVAWVAVIGLVGVSALAIWLMGPPALIGATPAVAALGVGATITLAGLVRYAGPSGVELLRSGYTVEDGGGVVRLRRRR